MTHNREVPGDTPAEQIGPIKKSAWRRGLAAMIRVPAAALELLVKPTPTSSSRRALLQGRLWKLIPQSQLPSLMTRLPKPDREVPTAQKQRSIAGITIDPVSPTNLRIQQVVRTIPVHRPPGAINELQFLAGCTGCGDCIAACPYDALVTAPERFSSIVGTPLIEADSSACWMCVDFPCIAACDAGVLNDVIPPIMGTARVIEHLCLAHHHTTCTVCSERCPVHGAITISAGKPSVNEEICTGCGVCRYVCPAPENAILLMPTFSRPQLPNA